MDNEQLSDNRIEQMRDGGNLPARSERVLEISRLAKRNDSSPLNLATVKDSNCPHAFP